MRKWLQGVVRTKNFFVLAGLMVALQPLYGVFTAPIAGAASQVVTGDTSTWLFNRDPATDTPFHFTTAQSKTGQGSLYVELIGANPADKFVAENFDKTPVNELQSIGYDFKIAGNGTPASANQFYLNVYANIDDTDNYYDCRFDYTPTASSLGFTKAMFAATDTPTHVQQRGARTTCPATLAEMPAGSHMRAFAINVGDSSASDAGLAGYLDNVVVKKTTAQETYDFERELPSVQYVVPSASRNEFRPADNPLRVRISDTQEVTRVAFSIWRYDPATGEMVSQVKNMGVNRNSCNLNNAGQNIVCDVKESGAWESLAAGTYKAKLTVHVEGEAAIRANMDEYWSPSFTVDDTRPTASDLVLESPTSGYTNSSATVAATASDDNTVESVNFYVTMPRASDNECVGNGAKLVDARVSAVDTDGKYRTALDLSALTDGEYCITAQARDQARNNSNLQHVKVVVDKTAPTLAIQTPNENAVFGGDDQIVVTSVLEDGLGLENFFIDINSANVTILSDPEEIEELPEGATTEETTSAGLTVITIYNAADFADGEYVITARVTDKAGNVTEQNRTIFIDHSVPPVPPTPGSGSGTPPTDGTTTDEADDELARLTQQLTQPFSVPRSFIGSANSTQTNQDVLGIDNGEENEVASGEQIVAAAPSEDGWKIFGIAWYWWLLLATILGIVTAWIMRRRGAEA